MLTVGTSELSSNIVPTPVSSTIVNEVLPIALIASVNTTSKVSVSS